MPRKTKRGVPKAKKSEDSDESAAVAASEDAEPKPKRRSPQASGAGAGVETLILRCPEHATQVRLTIPGTGRRTIKEGEPLTVSLDIPQKQALLSQRSMVEIEVVKQQAKRLKRNH